MSQTPADARQAVTALANPSTGHALLVPLHVSPTSHTPADARHEKPDARSASAGQVALVPLQVSAASQAPAATRHVVAAVAKASAGQVAAVPLQVSAASQVPTEARQTVAEAALTFPQVPAAPPVSAAEHAWQSVVEPPPHVVLQQTPSTQLPLVQVEPAVQAVPFAAPVAQSLSSISQTPSPSLSMPIAVPPKFSVPVGLQGSRGIAGWPVPGAE